MSSRPADEPLPLRLGAPEDFRRVESFLRHAGFDETSASQVLGSAHHASGALPQPAPSAAHGDRLAVGILVRIFMAHESVPAADVERLIDPRTLASFAALDLLRQTTGAYLAPVLLYPIADLFIVSDRGEPFLGQDGEGPLPDVVFPPFYHGTKRFLQLLPQGAGGDVLDLCAGSGVGALVLSRHARSAVSADITGRASHFARFNRLLNQCANVEVVQGDLYEPVDGRTFDLVVAHPPYTPSESLTHVYRDGGATGEALVRRIVESAPRFLRPGGTLCVVCAAWDASGAPFERRVRAWLDDHGNDFDVIFALQWSNSAPDVAAQLAKRNRSDDQSHLAYWQRVFEAEGLERRVYGALVVRHRSGATEEAMTLRPSWTEATDAASFDRLVDAQRWSERLKAAGTLVASLAHARPRFTTRAHFDVVYAAGTSGLRPEEAVLETQYPFGFRLRIEPWMVDVVTKFDGVHTAEEAYASGRASGSLPATFQFEHVAKLLALGVERGVWELEAGDPLSINDPH